MFQGIDLSSDTATKPSLAMKKYMLEAEVGDEQKYEDPTTLQLETMAANLFGFESAVFLPSATMANEIAVCALSNHGEILLAAENCHLFLAESGGPAVHAQVLCRSIPTTTGIFTPEDIEKRLAWTVSAHHPTVSVLSVENTSNFGGGITWPKKMLHDVSACAKSFSIKTHLDGSRLFNASIKTKIPVREMAKEFDMVTICLSKGLGCPVGALLIYNKEFDKKVQYLKKLMGGAMRQSGILAAAGIYALQHNIERLQTDHENAYLLAKEIKSFINHIKLITPDPETNMVYFDWVNKNVSSAQFLSDCIKEGLRFSQIGKNTLRAVTHLDISTADIYRAGEIIKGICLKYQGK